MIYDGQLLNAATRQLSIVAPSKKRVKGKLQKDIKVSFVKTVHEYTRAS